ncbi:hypothetical protein ABPG77_005646 [Micractinium sp. CCAP 211/92]
MPKPRARGAIGAPSYFAVSPWQDREDQRQSDEGPAGYSIVEMFLVIRSNGGAGTSDGSPLAAGTQPDAMAMDVAGVEECAVLPSCQPSSAPAAPPSAAGGGWLTKKRKQVEEGEALTQQQASNDFPLPVRGSSGGEPDVGGAEQGGHEAELEGTAYLALLPNGSITGHLVCSPSALAGAGSRRSFGLMGEVVVAGRECTRDADWGVLRLTLVNFAAGGAASELSFLSERTEGDAMRLRAPVPWQGIELEELPTLDATCSCPTALGLSLDFRCSQLLSGSAAEAALRRLQPSLAGRGALLNVGEMRVRLPPDAAEALLGGKVGAAGTAGDAARPALQQQTPSPRQGGGATAAQFAAGGQRRLTGGGSGGGSGRVVADAEDDW